MWHNLWNTWTKKLRTYLSFSFSSCLVRLQSWRVSSCCVTSSAQRQFTSSRSWSGALERKYTYIYSQSGIWDHFLKHISKVNTEVTNVLTQWGESFHNVYVYQTITFYTLNTLQFCQLYLNKAGKVIKSH